jgi:hypothetical protein
MKKTGRKLSLAKETLRTLDGGRSLQRALGASAAGICGTNPQASCGMACSYVCTVAGGCPTASLDCGTVSNNESNCTNCPTADC